jgi:formamidopyrimidine-DNA glycosylase
MLELPESQTLARQLRESILGKRIEKVLANTTPHGFAFYYGDPAGYNSLLAGKTVDDACAFGGQVEIVANDARLVVNDGINMRLYPAGSKRPDKHQLLAELSDGSAIVCTVQMYGGMQAFKADAYDNPYYHIAKVKPSPLSAAFDEAYFEKMMAESKPGLSAKAFLATEQRIPGLGNGVLQDILFRARIHPKAKLSSFKQAQKERLFTAVKETLQAMTDKGGRDTEKDLFGQPGGYICLLSKNTLDKPCPVCGGTLVRQAYLGGNIYFCPECQVEL